MFQIILKSCHCSEKKFVTGEFNSEDGTFAQQVKDYFGRFYRSGVTAPAKNIKTLLTQGNWNRVQTNGMAVSPFRTEECDVLDKIDDFELKNMAFKGKVSKNKSNFLFNNKLLTSYLSSFYSSLEIKF